MPEQKAGPDAVKLEWGKIIIPALVGLVGVIITTLCGFFSTVVVALLPKMPIAAHSETATAPPAAIVAVSPTPLPELTPTRDLPTVSLEALDFNLFINTPMSVYGKRSGEDYVGISPAQCWDLYLTGIKEPNRVERLDEVSLNYNFAVLSDKPVIISDITIHLDKYTRPPDPKTLSSAMYVWGRGGGGEVPQFTLDSVSIGAAFKHASLNAGKAYRLDANSAISYNTTVYFTEPGEYQFHVELEVTDFSGQTFAYSSKPLDFAWLYLDDIGKIKVTDGLQGDKVTIAPCKK